MINEEQAKVYTILGDLFCKVSVVAVFLGTWVALVVALICQPNWYLAAIDAIIPWTIYPMAKHFFPSSKKHTTSTKKKKKKG